MKETRNCKIEKRNEDSRIVEGYAIVFNSESRDLGGFTEVIEPTALEGVLQQSDILCLLNHNEDRGILARSKYGAGSLKLEVDSTGLKYSFEAPCTNLGDELLEGLKRGDITTSSFAFTIGQRRKMVLISGLSISSKNCLMCHLSIKKRILIRV